MIDCLVMAGGQGARMGFREKPLLSVCGQPMLLRVLSALRMACRRIAIVYSRHTPGVKRLCLSGALGAVECIEGPGSYVKDLRLGFSHISTPLLVAPADMPFLNPHHLNLFIDRALADGASIVNLSLRGRGLTGLSVFKHHRGWWRDVETNGCWALDVDTWEDFRRAGELCGGECTGEGLRLEL
ncbi:nucleoside triphosphate:adenosylcobinamide-phosphate guanylyltransferase [Aeropyrum pernix K1]|uniref:Nucleoside triphosphate:adenosylcobinamide-phosphate guanylyltransferase n=1 Tax=Aeropyrum pernix (strain ATCC 700893 / DSM 11879 / JCM 9820 / NBRC 100138 / K1) TaxID=272557 RepID=Q9YAA5_AERPE|nr:nucleoside triphosphate--adenosylcobinamide-phosphate guanylyltransferase [Aeropyrum pernix]BAA81044.2 nucleoside triphosphate:adenosylcobinamide-phosphate guanylyltransferase [Aeropyrum pernix K1]